MSTKTKPTRPSPQRKARPQAVATPIARVMWTSKSQIEDANYQEPEDSRLSLRGEVNSHADIPVAIFLLTPDTEQNIREIISRALCVDNWGESKEGREQQADELMKRLGLTAPESRQSKQGGKK